MVGAGPAYVDTSAYVKIYDSRESASKQFSERIGEVRTVASLLLLAETQSAFARKFREGDVDAQGLARLRSKLRRDWNRVLKIRLTDQVLAETERLIFRYDLRAADSIHLASATLVRNRLGGGLPIITADQKMASAAATEGFQVEHFGLLRT